MNRHLLCSLAAALLLAGCGGKPKSAGSDAPAAAASPDWRNDQVAQAVAQLNKGDRAGARRIVEGVLKRVPTDAAAQRLLDQIDGKVTVPERPPERDRRAAPPRRPEPALHRAPEPPRVAPELPPPPAPPAAARDPARAARLRGAGLEQMNRGAIARAVALLEQASRLDPVNPLIRRDLERAQRIQRTVRGSR